MPSRVPWPTCIANDTGRVRQMRRLLSTEYPAECNAVDGNLATWPAEESRRRRFSNPQVECRSCVVQAPHQGTARAPRRAENKKVCAWCCLILASVINDIKALFANCARSWLSAGKVCRFRHPRLADPKETDQYNNTTKAPPIRVLTYMHVDVQDASVAS